MGENVFYVDTLAYSYEHTVYYVRDVKYVRRFIRQLAHSERYHYIVH